LPTFIRFSIVLHPWFTLIAGHELVKKVPRPNLPGGARHAAALVNRQILEADRRVLAWHRSNAASRRLDHIPGIGPLIATALVASVPNPQAFKSGRDLAAWIGLVPKQNSSGGKERLGGISKHGNRYLRTLLTIGALSVIRYTETHGTAHRPWLARLLERRPAKVAAVALANKLARMAWAVMARGEAYREPKVQTA
jgi:transposase